MSDTESIKRKYDMQNALSDAVHRLETIKSIGHSRSVLVPIETLEILIEAARGKQ